MERARIEPLGDQESVWHYPRLRWCRTSVASSSSSVGRDRRDDSVPADPRDEPPPDLLPAVRHVRRDLLRPAEGASFCEWKGAAAYVDVVVGDQVAREAGWSYPEPSPRYATLHDHVAFYASRVDRCTVDGIEVSPQPGRFYGGWITPEVVGPFKGEPGTRGW